MSTFDPTPVNGLVGLWDFSQGQTNKDTGLDDGVAQDGRFEGDSFASNDSAVFDGNGDYFEVAGQDDPFDLDKGTIELRFTMGGDSGSDLSSLNSGPPPGNPGQTLVNRGEAADKDEEGHLRISVTDEGAIEVLHNADGNEATVKTSDDFVNEGDDVTVKYSWDAENGVQLEVTNHTTGETETLSDDTTGLTMDIGDNDDENFTFGAREYDDGKYDGYFNGKMDYVAIYEEGQEGGPQPDGVVDGEESGELMELGYDDSNAPTDGGGDRITNDADVIEGNGGDDTIDGAGGDDTIHGGDGSDEVTDMEGNNVIDTSSDGPSLPDRGFPAYGPFPEVPADPDPDDDRDSVTTGDGNDDITTGDDADTIHSGAGDDTIDSGVDDDIVDGGAGDDLITTGEGSDLVHGGDGNDTIYGGLGPGVPDQLNITDDGDGAAYGPDPEPDNGDDTLDGGAGNDVIYGEDDSDLIRGGTGDDTLDGGIDQDTIEGGAGNDDIIGGHGDDEMSGGDGDDIFEEAGGDGADTITDFNVGNSGSINDGDQTNNDFVDLSQFYNASTLDAVNSAGGEYDSALEMLRADAADGRIDGVIDGNDYSDEIGDVDLTLEDGDGNAVTGENLTTDNTNVPCFVRGTLIATRRGAIPVEELAVGDEVITMDHGFQQVRWIGSTTVKAEGKVAPVVFRRGAMGNERDLRVSPQHRMLVRGWHVELMFGKQEALVPAKALINDETVFQLEGGSVEYFHIMFDQHELVYSEGIPSESFHPGHIGLGSFARDTREEILHLFPELRENVNAYSEPVRPTLKVREAKVLAENPELIKE